VATLIRFTANIGAGNGSESLSGESGLAGLANRNPVYRLQPICLICDQADIGRNRQKVTGN